LQAIPERAGSLGWLDERHLIVPRVLPPLDPSFVPAAAVAERLLPAIRQSERGCRVDLAVEQPGREVSYHTTWTYDDTEPAGESERADIIAADRLVERDLKFLLWSRGGSRVYVDGPERLVTALRRHYEDDQVGLFDSKTLGEDVYRCPFEIVSSIRESFPPEHRRALWSGGHLDGCRIGFDLGASDRKTAAVMDGQVCFSEEVAWDPRDHADPRWHFDQIDEGLRRAAEHLPRVDAIGGSSAGIFVDNEPRVASLFRAVPPDQFRSRVRSIFHDLGHAWGDIPFVVMNDGDVTALAGAMMANVTGMLGVAMGSSQAAGYVSREGGLTAWLNELAFAPIDLSPTAWRDEWSGDVGVGAQYFSQQAVARLLPAAGIEAPNGLGQPELLLELQRLMAAGDPRAQSVYETIGVYLGYGLLQYRRFYDFGHLLLLGRVMSGSGGEVIEAAARKVLDVEAAGVPEPVFHPASERDKRHGQAVAAASLPQITQRAD
jgi:predicted NBD/HSP70 family sugar kinase